MSLEDTKEKTQRRSQCEDGCRDWSDAAICQRVPEITRSHEKLGEKYEMHSLPRTSREMWPSSHLDLGFLVSRTARE